MVLVPKRSSPKSDLEVFSGVELTNSEHSPIIGWAYDGNPIYGPYGFSNRDGSGQIRQMKSGYTLLRNPDNRPPYTVFPSGHFSGDYLFEGMLVILTFTMVVSVSHQIFLVVFMLILPLIMNQLTLMDLMLDSEDQLFPYLIGNTYNSLPNPENFKSSTTQSEYDFKGEWFRNTSNYHIQDDQSGYNYIIDSSKDKPQFAQVESISIGQISRIGIFTGGDGLQGWG